MMAPTPEDLALLEAAAAEPPLCPPGPEAFELLWRNLELLGSPDPRLRDELYYTAFEAWVGAGLLPEEGLAPLLERAISEEFLQRGLGSAGEDSVLARSFGALALAALVSRHAARPCLPEALLKAALAAALQAAAKEKDLRGYLPGLGWAHSSAHLADALGALASCPEFGKAELEAILGGLETLLFKNEEAYAHQEGRRIARAAAELAGRPEIGEEGLAAWAEDLAARTRPHFSDMVRYRKATELLGFLQSLFFYARSRGPGGPLEARLGALVSRLMRIPA